MCASREQRQGGHASCSHWHRSKLCLARFFVPALQLYLRKSWLKVLQNPPNRVAGFQRLLFLLTLVSSALGAIGDPRRISKSHKTRSSVQILLAEHPISTVLQAVDAQRLLLPPSAAASLH